MAKKTTTGFVMRARLLNVASRATVGILAIGVAPWPRWSHCSATTSVVSAAPADRRQEPVLGLGSVDHAFGSHSPSRLTAGTAMGAGLTSRARLVLAIHRLVLRTGRTRLRWVWTLAYRAMARVLVAYVSRGERRAAVYIRGSAFEKDFLPGVSDVDTTIVFADNPARPGASGDLARLRWERLSRAVPAVNLVLDGPMVFAEGDLRELAGTTALTHGLEVPAGSRPNRAGYFGRHANFDWLRKLERPGLYGSTADWRHMRGPDRRPPAAARDAQLRLIAAWLELVYLWRWTFPLCLEPERPGSAALCVKLIVEPARIWLWLAYGERLSHQEDVLRRALLRIPDEERSILAALALRRSLPRRPPAPVAETLPALVRLSARIAAFIGAQVASEGVTEVGVGHPRTAELITPGLTRSSTDGVERGRESGLLPLVDWRALSCPQLPDESFAPLDGEPCDASLVAALARSWDLGPYPSLHTDGLMLLPAGPWWRTRLRAIQCPVTDPVSFALTRGEPVARFANARGWSARDTARRAVAEHDAWLRGQPGNWTIRTSIDGAGGELGMLFTAVRAVLFLESIAESEPQLPLTVAETARSIATRSPAEATLAEEALGRYRDFALRRVQPPAVLVAAMRRLVREMSAYAHADEPSAPWRG
jgi:hypothetical protein